MLEKEFLSAAAVTKLFLLSVSDHISHSVSLVSLRGRVE